MLPSVIEGLLGALTAVVVNLEVVVDPKDVEDLANAITNETLLTDVMKGKEERHIISHARGNRLPDLFARDLLGT